MTSIYDPPFFEVGIDGLQPFLVSLALSLTALSTLSTIGRIAIGQRRGESWTGQVLSLLATVSDQRPLMAFGTEAQSCIVLCVGSYDRPYPCLQRRAREA